MSAIVFRHVEWVDPHGSALSPLEIDILFEVVEPGLMQDVNFKMLYIAAKPGQTLPGFTATDEDDGIVISQEDVVLDEVDAGPLEKLGKRRVRMSGGPIEWDMVPDATKLDICGVVLSACYAEKEFYRIGWYVQHEYEDEKLNADMSNRPKSADMSKCVRRPNVANPVETKIDIPWEEIMEEDRKTAETQGGPEAKRLRLANTVQERSSPTGGPSASLPVQGGEDEDNIPVVE